MLKYTSAHQLMRDPEMSVKPHTFPKSLLPSLDGMPKGFYLREEGTLKTHQALHKTHRPVSY